MSSLADYMGVLVFLLIAVLMSAGRRAGAKGGLFARLKEELLKEVRRQQAAAHPPAKKPAERAQQARPVETAPVSKPAPVKPGEWRGLEGTQRIAVEDELQPAPPETRIPLPLVSGNAVVQAVVMAEVLTRRPTRFGGPRRGL